MARVGWIHSPGIVHTLECSRFSRVTRGSMSVSGLGDGKCLLDRSQWNGSIGLPIECKLFMEVSLESPMGDLIASRKGA